MSLDPNRVDAVHNLNLTGLTQFAYNSQGIIKIALYRDRVCTVHQCLCKFTESDFAVRQ